VNAAVKRPSDFVEIGRDCLEGSLIDRFRQQCARHGERVAVVDEGSSFTYDRLDEYTDVIARSVRAADPAETEKPVAVVVNHSAKAVVALIGVLKTGRPYVPLDPRYPASRNRYLLLDSQATLVLSDDGNENVVAEFNDGSIPVLNLDRLSGGSSDEEIKANIEPERPAFILYTSGSTGKPKGAIQTHQNVLHEVMNYTNGAGIAPSDRMVLVSSLSFGDSVRTVYAALCNGATLYPFDVRSEGLAALADWMVRQRITVYRSVPTLFRHFAASLSDSVDFPHLRLVYMAGEPVYRVHFDLYRRLPAECIFVNGLGSIETFTFRWAFYDKESEFDGVFVPVGHGLSDKETLLLDEVGREVEAGEIGEMVVKSRYLSPGYWGQADLTAAAFRPAPESDGQRMYNTGDLGRVLSDGTMVHVGRRDFQVKIRGHRVETAEIEHALRSIAGVEEAVVAATDSREGDSRLVAYTVLHEGSDLTGVQLHDVLAQSLPAYMVPSVVVLLDALPLLPNGKINRRALPEPPRTRPQLPIGYVEPRTPVERKLSRIWAHVLDLDRVGSKDDFLQLGGQSLMAMRIVNEVTRQFGVAIKIGSLLEASTVAAMAQAVEHAIQEDPAGRTG
jgi:amino acid adenylation domain-containing protein